MYIGVDYTHGTLPDLRRREHHPKISVSLRSVLLVDAESALLGSFVPQSFTASCARRLTVPPFPWVRPCCLPSPMTRARSSLSCVKGGGG